MDNKAIDNLFADMTDATLAYTSMLKRKVDQLEEENKLLHEKLTAAHAKISELSMTLYGRGTEA